MREVTRIQRKDFASDLDEFAREGARRMLAVALEAEAADYIARHQERDEHGRAQVVRNGKAPPRKLTVGSSTIEVRAPRVDDRRHSEDGRRRTFRKNGLLMAFKLLAMAELRWRRINGPELVPLVRAGALFHDGLAVERGVRAGRAA